MASRFPSALCSCSAKRGPHVHCQCKHCNGRAVHRRTQLNHLQTEFDIQQMLFGQSSSFCTDERVSAEEIPEHDNSQIVGK